MRYWVVFLSLVACQSPLPDKHPILDPGAQTPLPDAGGPPRLRFDPPAREGAVSPITRLTLEFPGALVDPRVVLVAGALSAPQLRDVARPTLPQSLTSRAVSALVWLEADPSRLVVAPLVALEPGGLYTLALGAPLVSMPFTVLPDDDRPVLARVFPDRDEPSPSARAAVWCGVGDHPLLDAPTTLEPALVRGRFQLGTGVPLPVPRCVSWLSAESTLDPNAPPALAPPSVTFADDSRAALEPTMLFGRDAPAAGVADCAASEVPFGPGCALVDDDRLVLRSGEAPILWTVDCGERPVVRATRSGAAFTLRPLPADHACRVATLDGGGRVTVDDVVLVPAPPRPHVVLNEVMANPAGSEPSQEWVEIYNDGQAPVALSGFVLEDAGGRSTLPDAVLDPGAFALIVAEAYVAGDGADPTPAAGAALLRVPALGRSGLSNEGERLVLRDGAASVLSTFPAVKTKNGVSIARTAPDAPDADPASFVASPNGSATPGAPNGVP